MATAADATMTKVCNLCNIAKPNSEFGAGGNRCGECNPLRIRIIRMRKNADEAEQEHLQAFDKLSQQDRAQFFAENPNTFSDQLMLNISTIVTRSSEKTREHELVGTGEFLDEDDLRTHYKDWGVTI